MPHYTACNAVQCIGWIFETVLSAHFQYNIHIHSLIFSNDSKCGGIYGLSPCLTFLLSAQSLHSFNAHLVLRAVVPGSAFFCTCLTSLSDLGLQNLLFTASVVGGWGSKGLGKKMEFATNMSFSSIWERS